MTRAPEETPAKAEGLRAAVAAWRAAPPDVRAPFLARVAENAEAIAARDESLGQPARRAAAARMAGLLGREGDHDTLQAALADAIRTGALDVEAPALRDHLRRTALDELAINQPRYRHGLALSAPPRAEKVGAADRAAREMAGVMEFDEVIRGRRSIRGYRPDPVPRALIEEILALAMRAPSSMNTQPWNFYVVTGEPLDRIRAGNTERMVAGVPQSREFRTGGAFAGHHRDRQVGVAKQLFSAMGIARDDKDMRQDWVLRGFRQFDAPVCVIVTYDRELADSDDTAFDCGAVTNALVNAAWSRGLGAVINSQGIMQSPVVREHAGVADDQVIMKSIALGWPDEAFPANAVVSERKTVAEAARFVGFDGA